MTYSNFFSEVAWPKTQTRKTRRKTVNYRVRWTVRFPRFSYEKVRKKEPQTIRTAPASDRWKNYPGVERLAGYFFFISQAQRCFCMAFVHPSRRLIVNFILFFYKKTIRLQTNARCAWPYGMHTAVINLGTTRKKTIFIRRGGMDLHDARYRVEPDEKSSLENRVLKYRDIFFFYFIFFVTNSHDPVFYLIFFFFCRRFFIYFRALAIK